MSWPPFKNRYGPARFSRGVKPLRQLGDSPDAATLAHWFETVITVQRAAVGSPEFYRQTSQALVDLVGLDRGMVLLLRDQGWEVAATYDPDGAEERGLQPNDSEPGFERTPNLLSKCVVGPTS